MTLLDFARGLGMQIALSVFVLGVLWRLLSLMLLPWSRERSVKRDGTPIRAVAAVQGFIRHMWPASSHARTSMFVTINGYVFHLGLAIVVFGFAQHILFFKGLFGLSWPGIPSTFINIVAVVTFASLIAALVRRISNPVTRLLSSFNDYFSWTVTALPVLTGLLAVGHYIEPYETILALHILSVELLLVWFPFGKLMHAFLVFLTRSETGVFYSRRGVDI
ncbi:MAG: nitrate reductase [Hyphomicrobiaceae bacterium]|nr:nitrate reductase [Hyphomicrobiaceae bacterium]